MYTNEISNFTAFPWRPYWNFLVFEFYHVATNYSVQKENQNLK